MAHSTAKIENDVITKFAEAIEHREGFHAKRRVPTIAQRLNNPGNLTHWKDAAGVPYPEVNGFVEFPDYSTGKRALVAQCKINILKRGLTWVEFFAGKAGVYRGYAPKTDPWNAPVQSDKNDPADYAARVLAYVSHGLGVTEDQDGKPLSIHTKVVSLVQLISHRQALLAQAA